MNADALVGLLIAVFFSYMLARWPIEEHLKK
jgi:hypothetical protein